MTDTQLTKIYKSACAAAGRRPNPEAAPAWRKVLLHFPQAEVQAAGVSVGHWPKESREWTVSWWQAIDGAVMAQRKASAELSRTAAPVALAICKIKTHKYS